MARIVVRCQYTGHYMFTGFDTKTSRLIAGGRIHCPYCDADHIWTSAEIQPDEGERSRPLVRQAS